MSARFSAVVWDVDGVLIDSEPLHCASIMALFERGGQPFSEADNHRWLGKSLGEMWRSIPEMRTLAPDIDTFRNAWIDYYIERVHAGMARRPAPDIVARLAARGIAQAAASSSPRRIVEANVAAVGVDGHLGAIIADGDVENGKPAPDPYLEAAARLGMAPADCLAVEDTATGVAAARAAGFTVIAWPNEMTLGMDFSRADFRLEDLEAFDWDRVIAP